MYNNANKIFSQAYLECTFSKLKVEGFPLEEHLLSVKWLLKQLKIASVWNSKPWIQMEDCDDKPICQIYKRVIFSQWYVVVDVVVLISCYN